MVIELLTIVYNILDFMSTLVCNWNCRSHVRQARKD